MMPEELQELCALYVLGILEPQAAADLEARLRAGDVEVVREMEAFRKVVELLPYALPPLPPDPAVRAQLMARVQTALQEPRRDPTPRRFLARFRTPLAWLPTAAAVLLAVTSVWFVYDLRQQVTALETKVRQLRSVAGDHERLLTLLTSPSVKMVTLAGTANAPGAGARLLWDTQRGEWTVLAHNLPILPSGKAYQLWFLTAGDPIPSDTFHLDARRRGIVWTQLPTGRVDIAGAAVTLEPEGGVSQPTGPMVLAAKF
jgi:anti-sigma-K factor RskA